MNLEAEGTLLHSTVCTEKPVSYLEKHDSNALTIHVSIFVF